MMWLNDEDNDDRILMPTLAVVLAAALVSFIVFWLPLFAIVWHWWLA